VPDPSFIAVVAALLLANAGEGFGPAVGGEAGRIGWSGLGRLLAIVRARFAGDADAERALTEAQRKPTGQYAMNDLAAAVERHADIDPGFREEIRRLVVDAYADPVTARRLPDPSPRI